MKTKESAQLKEGYVTLNKKLKELTEEDLKSVSGGFAGNNKQLICPACKKPLGTTLEVIVSTKSLICPECGLHLYID